VSVERDETLRRAEKLLRQGKLDGAIAEYVQLVTDQPGDWSSMNALGDLYLRAGQTHHAVTQFTRVADHLFEQGFLPKAAALYKKILKVTDDEHSMLRLADSAARQGVLVDAKAYLRQAAELRRMRGDHRGAAEMIVQVGELDPADAECKMVAARAAVHLGDTPRACALLVDAAAQFDREKRAADALAALAEAVRLDPDRTELRNRLLHGFLRQGDVGQARAVARTSAELQEVAHALEHHGRRREALEVLTEAAQLDPQDLALRARLARECLAEGFPQHARTFLSPDTVGDDPELLLTLARVELETGRIDQARSALTRLLTLRPDRRRDLVTLACALVEGKHLDAAFASVEMAADAALLEEDWAAAAAALDEFVSHAPAHIPALLKLVEICVDAGLETTMHRVQAQLADAYLAAGLGAEARVIAEDLVAREPWVAANVDRFRRALVLLGVLDPDAIIVERLSGDNPFSTTVSRGGTPEPSDDTATETPVSMDDDATVMLDEGEIDLNEALAELASAPSSVPDANQSGVAAESGGPAPDLERVFEGLRAKAATEGRVTDAEQAYAAGLENARNGRIAEAMDALQAAARSPLMRFQASAELGRLYVRHGELGLGVDWMERAAEAPAPSADEGHALMYDLADALERLGESARALAVLLELQADAGRYRDVAFRVDRLSRVQTEG
jgi:tetratricopeptide (TPR) repeat protein